MNQVEILEWKKYNNWKKKTQNLSVWAQQQNGEDTRKSQWPLR